MRKEKGIVQFRVHNQSAEITSRWKELMVIYNSTKEEWACPSGDEEAWEILADGLDSWLWQKNCPAGNPVKVPGQSVLILGMAEEAGETA